VNRRTFISVVTVSLLAAPGGAEAQPAAKTPRVAALGLTPIPPSLAEAFKQGLGEFGYTDGQNIAIEYRDADGKPERLSQLAGDLVRLNVDVILVRGGGALSAAKQATSRIPIVAVDLESDPAAMGFVRNLARPGGNIPGVFLDLPELSGKQLQLLKEIIRPLSRVAVLGDSVLNAPRFDATEVAARAFLCSSNLQKLVASWPTDQAYARPSAGLAASRVGSCKAPSRRKCRWSGRRSSSW
jgi:putative ABC transport system substrate-binding protein